MTPVRDIAALKSVGAPSCKGAVICGRQELPDDFGKGSVDSFRSFLKKASPSGPVVVVTARAPRGGFSDVGKLSYGPWEQLGHNVPELARQPVRPAYLDEQVPETT